jgi:hypothetical protein
MPSSPPPPLFGFNGYTANELEDRKCDYGCACDPLEESSPSSVLVEPRHRPSTLVATDSLIRILISAVGARLHGMNISQPLRKKKMSPTTSKSSAAICM